MFTRRTLFRTQALRHYAQNRQKDILPSFINARVFLVLWSVLLLTFVALVVAWRVSVPVYAHPSGILLEGPDETTTALLFVPASADLSIQVGQEVALQVNVSGQQFMGSVASVDRRVMEPGEARAYYHLTGDAQFVVTRPSFIVHLAINMHASAQVADHVSVAGMLQTGSRSLLSLLPDLLANAFGG